MHHTHAIILSTGDEIVLGQLLDTNARWIADRLTQRGIRVTEFITVGDDQASLTSTLARTASKAPLVIMSGGLGPTDGDLTRHALCDLTADQLITDDAALTDLTAKLTKRGREVSARQLRQSQRPSRATCIPNPVGTAPGLFLNHQHTDIVALPGPPGELQPMWAASIEPWLRSDPARTVQTQLLYIVGEAEADAADRIKDLTARGQHIVVNLTAHGGILTLRARYEGPASHAVAKQQLDATIADIRARFAGHIFAHAHSSEYDGQAHLLRAILHELNAKKHMLSTIESCTGGLLGALITNIPGSSSAYLGGAITYSNDLKHTFADVPEGTIKAHGAVSVETARAMAIGGRARTRADYTLAVTGIAGPDGGTPDKPVGTVCIALASATHVESRRFTFPGARTTIRERAATSAFAMLWFLLQGQPAPRLLWQHAP